ncbi:MAG: protein kinase [Myxococcota bacterium]
MTVASPSISSGLAAGTVVGGRFAVESTSYSDALGVVLRSKDQKTNKPIALRLISPGLVDGAAMKVLRSECRTAAALSHRSIVTTYGVGTAGGRPFVATEWVEGITLQKALGARKSGGPIALGSVFHVIEQLCAALTAAQPKTCHGTLRPSCVWLLPNGRVELADFGLGKALLMGRGPAAFAREDQPCFAPEVKAGAAPTASADIFGLGALLYTLLTGRSPGEGFVPPSQVHPGASADLDEVLLTCLAADPAARLASPDEVRAALRPLLQGPAELHRDFGLDVAPPSAAAPASPAEEGLDVDIDLASVAPPASTSAPAVVAPPAAALPFAAPGPAPRSSLVHEAPDAPTDLGAVLKKITENDAPRWMVDKDGLSHGPFDGRELVELIVKGEVLEEHELSNMDTGERKNVGAWAEFREFVQQQKIRAREAARSAALEEAEQSEKRSGLTKLIVGGALVASLVIGVTIFFVTRETSADEVVADAEMGELFEHGEIEITSTADILPDPPRRRGRGRMRGGGGMGGGFAGSYEDAMNRAVDIGDATMGGGQGRLSPAQVTGVLNRHVNRIYQRCVVPEARRGGRLGNVTIDVAIAGSGSVMGVSARQGSGAFKSCVRGAVRGVRFPSFGAPRMGARYSFDASP